jgi:short-subunit dehydrogenase
MPLPTPSPTGTAVITGASSGIGADIARVRTEFLQAAGMDEEKFAAAFPKFLWMASRDVARIGVEALENDRGIVIAGLRNVLSTAMSSSIRCSSSR